MSIGEKIRKLRKENDITQEKLAEYLNISYQAVSKWENGSTMPDISLVIPLANFFGVSTDVLFDLETVVIEEEIANFDKEGMRLSNLGHVKEAILLWRGAVSRYPKSYHCLVNLAYALLHSRNCSEIQDEQYIKECLGEAVHICERVLSDCTNNEDRSSAAQILVLIFAYGPLKNEEKAVDTASKAVSLIVSKELLLQHAYSGDKRKKQRHLNTLSFIDLICSNLVHDKYTSTDEYIKAFETALGVYQIIFCDENYLFYHCRVSDIHMGLAKFYCEKRSKEKVLKHLVLAKKHANAYDLIPDGEQHYTSIFLHMASHNNEGTSKNFMYSHTDLIKEELKQKHFDFLRNDFDFIAFTNNFC